MATWMYNLLADGYKVGALMTEKEVTAAGRAINAVCKGVPRMTYKEQSGTYPTWPCPTPGAERAAILQTAGKQYCEAFKIVPGVRFVGPEGTLIEDQSLPATTPAPVVKTETAVPVAEVKTEEVKAPAQITVKPLPDMTVTAKIVAAMRAGRRKSPDAEFADATKSLPEGGVRIDVTTGEKVEIVSADLTQAVAVVETPILDAMLTQAIVGLENTSEDLQLPEPVETVDEPIELPSMEDANYSVEEVKAELVEQPVEIAA